MCIDASETSFSQSRTYVSMCLKTIQPIKQQKK